VDFSSSSFCRSGFIESSRDTFSLIENGEKFITNNYILKNFEEISELLQDLGMMKK
jgi:hypothetical protein